MSDEKTLEQAQYVYSRICEALDERNWRYEKDEERLLVHFGVNGDGLPIKFIIMADAQRQVLRVFSPLSFEMSEEKRMEGAVATCAVNYGMADGYFDYDLSNGQIVFRATAGFRQSVIGVGLVQYLIELTCAMVDKYNQKFLALDKGVMSIADFIKKD